MKILCIEDDENIAEIVKIGLESAGWTVEIASSGTEGIELAREGGWGLLVVDGMLPGMDGIEICKRLRSGRDRTPILMLTARDTVKDEVRGLEAGADDYLTKPFSMEVLLARCRVLLRRDAREKSRYIHIDDLEVDTVNHTVKRGGIDLQLTQREFGVFEALLLREGTVISREQLRLRVWNDDAAVGSNVVDVYVKQLRSKLDDTREPRLIRTVYGAGYVGLVAAACFAEAGHDVLTVDSNSERISELEQGRVPFVEAGLDVLVAKGVASKRLRFTDDTELAAAHGAIHLLAVGTPSASDGSTDESQLITAAHAIGRGAVESVIVVVKSTAPVGAAERVRDEVRHEFLQRGVPFDAEVVVNPEFLRAGT
jgi:DNA-binding response OmpR family regulator